MENQLGETSSDENFEDADTSESLTRKSLPAWAKLLLALLCLMAIAESFSIVMVSGTPPQSVTKHQQSN